MFSGESQALDSVSCLAHSFQNQVRITYSQHHLVQQCMVLFFFFISMSYFFFYLSMSYILCLAPGVLGFPPFWGVFSIISFPVFPLNKFLYNKMLFERVPKGNSKTRYIVYGPLVQWHNFISWDKEPTILVKVAFVITTTKFKYFQNPSNSIIYSFISEEVDIYTIQNLNSQINVTWWKNQHVKVAFD